MPSRKPFSPAASTSRPAESPGRVGEHRPALLPARLVLRRRQRTISARSPARLGRSPRRSAELGPEHHLGRPHDGGAVAEGQRARGRPRRRPRRPGPATGSAAGRRRCPSRGRRRSSAPPRPTEPGTPTAHSSPVSPASTRAPGQHRQAGAAAGAAPRPGAARRRARAGDGPSVARGPAPQPDHQPGEPAVGHEQVGALAEHQHRHGVARPAPGRTRSRSVLGRRPRRQGGRPAHPVGGERPEGVVGLGPAPPERRRHRTERVPAVAGHRPRGAGLTTPVSPAARRAGWSGRRRPACRQRSPGRSRRATATTQLVSAGARRPPGGPGRPAATASATSCPDTPGTGALAGAVDVGHHHHVGVGERRGRTPRPGRRARVAVGLEHGHHPAPAAGPGRGQRGRDLAGQVGVVVDEGHAVRPRPGTRSAGARRRSGPARRPPPACGAPAHERRHRRHGGVPGVVEARAPAPPAGPAARRGPTRSKPDGAAGQPSSVIR